MEDRARRPTVAAPEVADDLERASAVAATLVSLGEWRRKAVFLTSNVGGRRASTAPRLAGMSWFQQQPASSNADTSAGAAYTSLLVPPQPPAVRELVDAVPDEFVNESLEEIGMNLLEASRLAATRVRPAATFEAVDAVRHVVLPASLPLPPSHLLVIDFRDGGASRLFPFHGVVLLSSCAALRVAYRDTLAQTTSVVRHAVTPGQEEAMTVSLHVFSIDLPSSRALDSLFGFLYLRSAIYVLSCFPPPPPGLDRHNACMTQLSDVGGCRANAAALGIQDVRLHRALDYVQRGLNNMLGAGPS